MAGEFLATLGDASQLRQLMKGSYIKGRGEARVALVGRSNVGKSTLLNALLGARLARISNEPGKTRQIHFYFWKDISKIVADLPGYGYAKAGHEERERWSVFVNQYIKADEALERAVVLLDSRHGPSDLDVNAIRFLAAESVPLFFVFTKTDQLKTQSERAKRKKEAEARLLELGYDSSLCLWVSAKDRTGIDALTRELKSGTVAQVIMKEVL